MRTLSAMLTPDFRLHFLLHFVVFIWGFTGILGKLISVDQYVLVWWRMLIAFGTLALFLVFTRRHKLPSPKDLLRLLGTGLIIALHWIFFYGAIKIANVSVAVTCLAVSGFFTALLQPLFTRTPFVRYEILLGLVVIAGVAVLVGLETQHTLGFVWGLLAALFATVFTLINASLVKRVDSSVISFYEMLGGFGGLSIYLWLSGGLTLAGLSLNADDTGYLLLLGICCTAFPFVASVWIMRRLSPYTVSISLNLEPIYTILLALVFFPGSEKMTPGFYLGTLIILAAVAANTWFKMAARKKRQATL